MVQRAQARPSHVAVVVTEPPAVAAGEEQVPTYRPQQQAGEVVGVQERLVDPQQSVLGETLERACQGGQDPRESPAAQ